MEVPGWPDSRCGEGKAEFMKKHSTIVRKTQLPARLRPAARTPSRVTPPCGGRPLPREEPSAEPPTPPWLFPIAFPASRSPGSRTAAALFSVRSPLCLRHPAPPRLTVVPLNSAGGLVPLPGEEKGDFNSQKPGRKPGPKRRGDAASLPRRRCSLRGSPHPNPPPPALVLRPRKQSSPLLAGPLLPGSGDDTINITDPLVPM